MWEQDFVGISSEIAELYEEIRKEKNEQVKELLEAEKKVMLLLTNAVSGYEKLGYDVPQESSDELLEEGYNEIDILVQNDSIFDAHYAGILLPLLSKKLKRRKDLLRKKGNDIYIKLDHQIQDLSRGIAGKKKKGGTVPFLIQFLGGQIVAFPFGWYIGIPLGLCITECLLLAICFYVNVIMPQSQWAEVSSKQNKQEKISRVIRKL